MDCLRSYHTGPPNAVRLGGVAKYLRMLQAAGTPPCLLFLEASACSLRHHRYTRLPMSRRRTALAIRECGMTRAALVVVLVFVLTCLPHASRARPQWVPANGAPPASLLSNGVRFPLPFDRTASDRLYWDFHGPWSAGDRSLLELEFSVERTDAIRSCRIYFESGEGWYVGAVPIRGPGRQRIFLPLELMGAEGRPGGWNSIRRVRLSFWRAAPAPAEFTLHEWRAVHPLVTVVIGEESLPNANERAFAKTAAKRVFRWLEAMGLPCDTVSEGAFRANSAARVAILPYNLKLPGSIWREVQQFGRRGGRLIVCYSADARLAELMGVRVGTHLRLTNGLRWTSFRFLEPQQWPFPAAIAQSAVQLLPVTPARSDARVIANWSGETPALPTLPAWIASSNGFWMTQVPTSEDGPAKQWLFLGLIAQLAPDTWSWVAGPLLHEAGRVDSFRDFEDAVAQIRAAAKESALIHSLLDRAARSRAQALNCAAAGEWSAFASAVRETRRLLTESYARIQVPRRGERVGIWDHSGTGWYPGDWDRTCRELRAAGVTDVFVNLLWPAQAHFPSDIVPMSYTARAHGDQAAAVLAAARRHGLRVHLWKVCWNLDGLPEAELRRLREAGALQTQADGQPLSWLNPVLPANADRELAAITNAAARYTFDGIHLDYIRWPGRNADFSPATRRMFERSCARTIARWPTDVLSNGPQATQFRQWRAGVISDFVRRVRTELRRIAPDMSLSAAVFADPADCPNSVGQDWPRWLREGWVDFVCPMNYDENLGRFAARCLAHASLPNATGRIWQGIGASAGESQLLADQVIEQILEARRVGAAGFVLFDMSPEVRHHILPMLRLGITAPSD